MQLLYCQVPMHLFVQLDCSISVLLDLHPAVQLLYVACALLKQAFLGSIFGLVVWPVAMAGAKASTAVTSRQATEVFILSILRPFMRVCAANFALQSPPVCFCVQSIVAGRCFRTIQRRADVAEQVVLPPN